MANEFLVEISARHVHVTKETLEVLFGKGYELTVKKELAGVSILGPCRSADQVELSATDARSVGIAAPIRESGDVKGSGACKLVGPAGEGELKEGVIVAKRHIHMTPEDAEKFGVKDAQIVKVAINTAERSLVFGDTVVRVSPKYALAMHVDTDEANAAAIPGSCMGTIVE